MHNARGIPATRLAEKKLLLYNYSHNNDSSKKEEKKTNQNNNKNKKKKTPETVVCTIYLLFRRILQKALHSELVLSFVFISLRWFLFSLKLQQFGNTEFVYLLILIWETTNLTNLFLFYCLGNKMSIELMNEPETF